MPHDFEIDKDRLREIEVLLPRLKHSVLPTKVIKWLENFNKNEVKSMLDLLSVFEYISYNEFLARLDDLFAELLLKIPNKKDEILIYPFGKFGKSGIFVTYPIAKTKAFEKRKHYIEISNDVKNLKFSNIKHIVFLDDFIGTGNTFIDFYNENLDLQNFIIDNKINSLHILACICMKKAEANIKSKLPSIEVIADFRNKMLVRSETPLHIFNYRDFIKIKSIVEKYGNKFNYTFDKKKVVYGYGESQSFVSFFHSTPNNALSIIWNDRDNWTPLYPRTAITKMSEAREFKKEVSFYINICNKLGIDISKTLLNFGKYFIKSQDELNNTKQDHSIILLLFLKNLKYEDIIICHILGLSKSELNLVYDEAKDYGLIDYSNKITIEGMNFIKRLKSLGKRDKIRRENNHNLAIEEVSYIPIMLNGTT
ncbi:hypothetical protein GCM10022217_01700 [Chryseobacterium ginsenosidimutans]|uniref:phosphoribosyltransferase-like protein n=1 Tax=Chryseobacterium ginsenosidimutans TaxID=687846 RepID=UPI0031DA576A